jgi:hypothetical protein
MLGVILLSRPDEEGPCGAAFEAVAYVPEVEE